MPIEWAEKGNTMAKILMSIHPEHVEKILSGIKKYEYRKVKCKKTIDTIVIYATYPIMKVMGEVEVWHVIEDSPVILWDRTKNGAGIDYSFFSNYYKGRNKAVAYQLGKALKYKHPKELLELGVKVAPQSYVYLTNN